MGWQENALCRTLPHAMFFPKTDPEITDKQLWDAHNTCRDCPVNYDCLAEALVCFVYQNVYAKDLEQKRQLIYIKQC